RPPLRVWQCHDDATGLVDVGLVWRYAIDQFCNRCQTVGVARQAWSNQMVDRAELQSSRRRVDVVAQDVFRPSGARSVRAVATGRPAVWIDIGARNLERTLGRTLASGH